MLQDNKAQAPSGIEPLPADDAPSEHPDASTAALLRAVASDHQTQLETEAAQADRPSRHDPGPGGHAGPCDGGQSSSSAAGDRNDAATSEGTELAEAGPQLSDEERQKEADELKAEGNALFGAGDWQGARCKYDAALDTAPAASSSRALYFCNMAACDLKQKQYDAAVQNASSALSIDPQYTKALMRRSDAFEALDDLDHALQDAKSVLALDPSSQWAAAAAARLEPQVAQRHEAVKTEMMGKLKELGNSILGNFGLSLDNFKAEKDPSTGSYSIQFNR